MTREWTKTRAGTRSKVNMVRYEAVNAMLLNEFLKRTAGSRNRKPAFEMKSTVATDRNSEAGERPTRNE